MTRSLDIIFPQAGQVALVEREVGPPGGGQVLCRTESSLISTGTETLCLRGERDPDTNWSEFIRFPFDPGYSAVGRVIAVGPDVDGFAVGDRVSALVSHRQYFTLDCEQATLIPPDITSEDAAWTTLACVTQLGIRRAALQLGEAVGVIGLGILGQLVVQYLALSGARQIVAIDLSTQRLELARRHGATDSVLLDAAAAREHVQAITSGKMLDVVFDVTGHPAVLAPATRLLRKLGRVILLGDTTTPARQHLGPRVVADSISIMGIHGSMYPAEPSAYHPWTFQAMAELFFTYLAQGRMAVADLVTLRCDPRMAPSVYTQLLTDRSAIGGVLFDWGQLAP
jgi:2-desacetyl-2-hydroxyethyl bacteriochlorophyllide A dehydrogenase